jgi:hypothetical protein
MKAEAHGMAALAVAVTAGKTVIQFINKNLYSIPCRCEERSDGEIHFFNSLHNMNCLASLAMTQKIIEVLI